VIETQFIEYVVKQLVDSPDAVKVERIVDEKGILLKLIVAPEDLGRVIGRHGATAQSLRNLLRALGTKNDEHYNLKIVDVDKPEIDDSETRESRENVEESVENPSESAETETENVAESKAVDNSVSEPVDNSSDRAKKLREDLANLDDLDI
jgi:predicted RNA-binding protein YlqC (UPF0109 family)